MDASTPDVGAVTTPHRYLFDFARPVRDEAYIQLLELAGRYCTSALVVCRSGLNQEGLECLDRLRPFTIESTERSEWPGTRLWKHTATVHFFVLNVESIKLLKSSAHAIGDWYYPNLPEDPCFLRADDTPWFQSTVHEDWAALRLSLEEAEDLRISHQALFELLAPPRDPGI